MVLVALLVNHMLNFLALVLEDILEGYVLWMSMNVQLVHRVVMEPRVQTPLVVIIVFVPKDMKESIVPSTPMTVLAVSIFIVLNGSIDLYIIH